MCQKDDQKELFRRSRFLQQEAVRLQKDLEKAVSGQAAIAELGVLAGKPVQDKIGTAPAGQSGRDPADDRSGWSPASAAELQMLLVKVRVSMKNLKEIGRKSREVNEQLQSLRDEISCGSNGSENIAAERLQSLQVTGFLLTQTEAEADALSSAYGELEAALKDAGKAVDEARSIQVRDALQRAAKLIGEAASASPA